jgi:hypothetical protein
MIVQKPQNQMLFNSLLSLETWRTTGYGPLYQCLPQSAKMNPSTHTEQNEMNTNFLGPTPARPPAIDLGDGMRKQYHIRASERGLLAWDVDRLLRLTQKQEPVSDFVGVPIDQLPYERTKWKIFLPVFMLARCFAKSVSRSSLPARPP